MALSDFFVPKYLHSNPKVRMKFVNKCEDVDFLEQMIEKDGNEKVVQAAKDRIKMLTATKSR